MRNDPSVDIGEVSFSQYLRNLANGDDTFIGLPVFLARGFEHRNFYVLHGGESCRLEDLKGKRVGVDRWSTTGSMWGRAAIRERGVEIERILWRVGSVDDASAPLPREALPPFAQFIAPGETLSNMLLNGKLDAVQSSRPPATFRDANSPIVRLLQDYRNAERDYYARTGVYPGHHILRIRKALCERHPWAVKNLYEAMVQSRRIWLESRKDLVDVTPWLEADIEEATALFGEDWAPYGLEANAEMLQAFCDEEFAQGLVSKAINSNILFSTFEKTINSQSLANS